MKLLTGAMQDNSPITNGSDNLINLVIFYIVCDCLTVLSCVGAANHWRRGSPWTQGYKGIRKAISDNASCSCIVTVRGSSEWVSYDEGLKARYG